jgi:hypothetical protein
MMAALLGSLVVVEFLRILKWAPPPPPPVSMEQLDELNVQLETDPVGNYVVLASTVTETARNEDYAYLLALSAISWSIQGFRPLIVLVAPNHTVMDRVRHLWDMVLPKEAKVLPILVSNPEKTITISQVSRLYASSLWQELDDDSFLRITDADMVIMESAPFAPIPDGSSTDITIFNGNCCHDHPPTNNSDSCNQYPMHSVGMKVGLWKQLFPMQHENDKTASDLLESFVEAKVTKLFPDYATSGKSLHGDVIWSIDQTILGCVIDHAIYTGAPTVELAAGPRNRVHVGEKFLDPPSEAHLAAFHLDKHEDWLNNLVDKTGVLSGYQERYREYTKAWTEFKSQV